MARLEGPELNAMYLATVPVSTHWTCSRSANMSLTKGFDADPEDIVLGPPRTSFASSGGFRNNNGRTADQDKDAKDGETRDRFNFRGRNGDAEGSKRRNLTSPGRAVLPHTELTTIFQAGALSSLARVSVTKELSVFRVAWVASDLRMTAGPPESATTAMARETDPSVDLRGKAKREKKDRSTGSPASVERPRLGFPSPDMPLVMGGCHSERREPDRSWVRDRGALEP